MTADRMLHDIRNQADSLTRVLDYQFGEGHRALLEAARRMKATPRIVITGMGASFYAAIPLADFLGAQGADVRLIEASELLHYQTRLCRNTAVVLVSRSGNTVEIAKLMPLVRELGAITIGVTNEADSLLAREADHVLLVHAGLDEMVAVQTYTGAVLAMLLLGAAVAEAADSSLRGAAESTIAEVGSLLARFEPASLEWRPLLESARVIYVLGRGPSLASVHEGALLFNETAKLPSVAAPAGTFRHGPVEVAGPDFRGIVFATQPETSEIDLALAADLEKMGAQIGTIAPGGSWPVPAIPRPFSPVAEIIPVQFAAMRTAQWRGIRPGDFRYVTQVTTTESGFKAYR